MNHIELILSLLFLTFGAVISVLVLMVSYYLVKLVEKKRKKMKCEIEHQENVRKSMKHPIEDNNNGYVYGLYVLDEDEVVDVEWFKTDKERFKVIKKYKLEIVN